MYSNENWENIEVYPYDLEFNRYDKPLYRQCQFEDMVPAPYGRLGVVPSRCGADAMKIVKRTSRLTGHTYETAACDRHLAGWELGADA